MTAENLLTNDNPKWQEFVTNFNDFINQTKEGLLLNAIYPLFGLENSNRAYQPYIENYSTIMKSCIDNKCVSDEDYQNIIKNFKTYLDKHCSSSFSEDVRNALFFAAFVVLSISTFLAMSALTYCCFLMVLSTSLLFIVPLVATALMAIVIASITIFICILAVDSICQEKQIKKQADKTHSFFAKLKEEETIDLNNSINREVIDKCNIESPT